MSGLLTSADLTELAALMNDSLQDSCIITRPTRTRDGAGGWTLAYQAVGTPSARYQQRNRLPTEGAGPVGNVTALAEWDLWLTAGTDITVQDRVLLRTMAGVFEVTRVDVPSQNVYVHADLTRFDG